MEMIFCTIFIVLQTNIGTQVLISDRLLQVMHYKIALFATLSNIHKSEVSLLIHCTS